LSLSRQRSFRRGAALGRTGRLHTRAPTDPAAAFADVMPTVASLDRRAPRVAARSRGMSNSRRRAAASAAEST
jgi:hypothetical protein